MFVHCIRDCVYSVCVCKPRMIPSAIEATATTNKETGSKMAAGRKRGCKGKEKWRALDFRSAGCHLISSPVKAECACSSFRIVYFIL